MDTPVKFEIAKLLKESTWVEYKYCYDPNDETKTLQTWSDNIKSSTNERLERLISAPTIAEVVMWFYEKHGIWISVECDCYAQLWFSKLSVASEKNWDNIDLRHEIISAAKKFPNEHTSPTEAYEEAITYCLNNLL